MKFSVITVCYNSAATIEDTIKSVIAQKGVDVEYIIIDGRSTDGTLDIAAKYKEHIATLVSEKDAGIYDAMNKGIKRATGEIVAILNSDDFYTGPDVLKKVEDSFIMREIDACYGDIMYVDPINTKRIIRTWQAGEYQEKKLSNGWIPPHPAFFVRRTMYEKYGGYNIALKIAADYECMLRMIRSGARLGYIAEPLVYMRSGGTSAASVRQRVRGWRELRESWRVNGWSVPFLFITRRIIRKLHQYFV